MKYQDLQMALGVGLSSSAVDQRARALREAGELNFGPRGLHAPDLSTREAADILLALRAPKAADAVETVKSTRAWPMQEGKFDAKTFGAAIDLILREGPTACGVTAVRFAEVFEIGILELDDGSEVRYGQKRVRGLAQALGYKEIRLRRSHLAQLWAKLNHPGRRGGWGKPKGLAANG